MKKIKVCIIGGGNISNTRHIPAALKNKKIEINGIIGTDEEKIKKSAKQFDIKNVFVINKNKSILSQVKDCEWFMNNVDAVIIGVPPKIHYDMVVTSLELGKHVLVEKPMMMNEEQCNNCIELAKNKDLVLNVMHNFQYSDGFMELEKRLKSGEFGNIESMLQIQFTNRDRRLPVWYNNLPLGLFYDEAAHFFYTAEKLCGDISIISADIEPSNIKENTPKHLVIKSKANNIPIRTFINFNSPVCEWGIILFCENKLVIFDIFKDIIIVADNDKQHLAKHVLKTSFQYTYTYWKGFMKNGFKMVGKKLLYGHDKVINKYIEAIEKGKVDINISGEYGRNVVKNMNKVIEIIESREEICNG